MNKFIEIDKDYFVNVNHITSVIYLCEADRKEERATVFYCLERYSCKTRKSVEEIMELIRQAEQSNYIELN